MKKKLFLIVSCVCLIFSLLVIPSSAAENSYPAGAYTFSNDVVLPGADVSAYFSFTYVTDTGVLNNCSRFGINASGSIQWDGTTVYSDGKWNISYPTILTEEPIPTNLYWFFDNNVIQESTEPESPILREGVYAHCYDLIKHYIYNDSMDSFAELTCTMLASALCVLCVVLPFVIVWVFVKIIMSVMRFM